MTRWIYYILILLGLCGASYYYGLNSAPDKVHTEASTEDKDKKIEEKNIKVIEKFDPTTGKITERIKEKITKDTTVNTTKNSNVTDKSVDKKLYAIKGGIAFNPLDSGKIIPRVGFEMRTPIPRLWFGAEGDINTKAPLTGIYGKLEF